MQQQSHSARSIGMSTYLFSIVIAMIVAFIVGTRSSDLMATIGPWFGVKISNDSLDLSPTEAVYRRLAARFDGTLDKNKLIEGATRGMVAASGDPHTVFLSKDEAEEFNNDLKGKVSGIGAEIGVRSGQPTILRVIDNSPAKTAGVKSGDVIAGVNNVFTKDFDAAKTAELVRGDEGTTVKLTVIRAGDTKDFSIVRAEISDTSVASSIEDGIGILKIRRFDSDTGDLSRRAAQMFKQQNVGGVVLDLRDNGGGLLDEVMPVLGLWLDNKIVVREYRNGKEVAIKKSTGEALLAGKKTVVLTNASTASASEIVAGALKDYKTATLIGETTYGKGTVQEPIDLGNGQMLKVTIEHWYTPNGVNITKKGIEPDKKVGLSIKDMDAGLDPQLTAAKDDLK